MSLTAHVRMDCYYPQHFTKDLPDFSYQSSSSTIDRNFDSWSLLDDDIAVFSKSTFRVLDPQDNDGTVFDELKIQIQQLLEYMNKWDQKVNSTSIGESTTQKFQQEGIETTKEELYEVRSTNEHKVFDGMTERKLDSTNKEWPPLVEVEDTVELPLVLIEGYNAADGEERTIGAVGILIIQQDHENKVQVETLKHPEIHVIPSSRSSNLLLLNEKNVIAPVLTRTDEVRDSTNDDMFDDVFLPEIIDWKVIMNGYKGAHARRVRACGDTQRYDGYCNVLDNMSQRFQEESNSSAESTRLLALECNEKLGFIPLSRMLPGTSRRLDQGCKSFDYAFVNGKLYDGEGFKHIKESFETGTLHFIGPLSNGGVHFRLDRLVMLLEGANEQGAKRIRVHALTDGRNALDGSSPEFVETLEATLKELQNKGIDAQIASGGGRMYVSMDRYENDWELVKRGWDAQVLGEAQHKFPSALEAVKTLRPEGFDDQYLPHFVIVDDKGKGVGPIMGGDAVVTFNFRAGCMTMLAKALEYENFDTFDQVRFTKICYAGMLQYDGELQLPKYLGSPPEIERTSTSGEYLVHNGVKTFACSETVKSSHVTLFWNGNRSGYFNADMEEFVEIPSDSGIKFNIQLKRKALEICEKARDAILSRKFHQIRVNIPNSDMVDHTGDIEAKAAELAVKMIINVIEQVGVLSFPDVITCKIKGTHAQRDVTSLHASVVHSFATNVLAKSCC